MEHDGICKNIFKVIIFTGIGCCIFTILQIILVPKRYSYSSMYDSGKLTNYYNENKNEIDILIEGTSHSAGGIFPMELYEGYGIKSYNLSTGTQSIEVSYYMASEAFKTQKPKVLILDVGNLYISDATEFHWRMVLDEMRFGKNKYKFANEYCNQFLGGDKASMEIMFPLLFYHTNWKSLSQQDFITYMNMLINEYNDKMILIAASDDMSKGLNETDINTLRLLGLKMDYSQAFDNSYIAVIENGQV